MNCWNTLGLTPTSDQRAIKRAYFTQLKLHRPEDDALAFQRVREDVLPLEDQHMKKLYGNEARSFIGKLLIFEREAPYLHRTVNLVLVNEVLGF